MTIEVGAIKAENGVDFGTFVSVSNNMYSPSEAVLTEEIRHVFLITDKGDLEWLIKALASEGGWDCELTEREGDGT